MESPAEGARVIYIGAIGMVSAVGANASASCAAIRAGVAGFGELPYKNRRGEPIVGAAVTDVALQWPRRQRLVELLAGAVAECLDGHPRLVPGETPVLIGLAETGRPAGGAPLSDTIVPRLEQRLATTFHPMLSSALATGHTSGFELLEHATHILASGQASGCIVCGVDSYINGTSLLWLEHQWRLKRDDHADGVIPGEAAAAVYLSRDEVVDGGVLVGVAGLGFGVEKATITSDEPLMGAGLITAATQALQEAGVKLHDMDFRLSDATGEAYGFKEIAQMVARLHRVWKPEVPHWHCADAIGDTGAAAGICQLVVAARAFRKGYAFGDRAMGSTSALSGRRAAVVLQRFGQPPEEP